MRVLIRYLMLFASYFRYNHSIEFYGIRIARFLTLKIISVLSLLSSIFSVSHYTCQSQCYWELYTAENRVLMSIFQTRIN